MFFAILDYSVILLRSQIMWSRPTNKWCFKLCNWSMIFFSMLLFTLVKTSQLLGFSVDATLAANRLMNKIKYCWTKTLRKTVLALLQIEVNFVLIPRKFIPDSFFRNQSLRSKTILSMCIWNSRFTLKNFTCNAFCALSFLTGKSLV